MTTCNVPACLPPVLLAYAVGVVLTPFIYGFVNRSACTRSYSNDDTVVVMLLAVAWPLVLLAYAVGWSLELLILAGRCARERLDDMSRRMHRRRKGGCDAD